jgi:hypothetical protein
MPLLSVSQKLGQFFFDNGSQSGDTAMAAENANINLPLGSLFIIRFELEIFSGLSVNAAYQLEYNLTGTWNNVNAASSVIRSHASAFIADGTATTQRMSETNVNFQPGVVDTVDGLTPAITLTTLPGIAPNPALIGATEVAFCCSLQAGDSSPGQIISLRLVDSAGNLLIQYLVQPTITVQAGSGVGTCWALTGSTATIDNPEPGDRLLLKGFTWAGTNQVVSVKIDKLLVTGSAKGGAAVPKDIKLALTKTGDYNAPATSFHSFSVAADGAQHDLGIPAIDFTGELTLSTAEIASGLVGIIIDFSDTFVNTEVVIGGGKISLGQSPTALGSGANGLVYGEVAIPSSCDEYLAIIGGGAFTENGEFVDQASTNNWSPNLIPSTALVNDNWDGCPFLGEFFITNAVQGVFRRRICVSSDHLLEPLYRDYINPGGSGGMALAIAPPPYTGLVLNHSLDSLTTTAAAGIVAYSGFPTAPTANIDPTTNLVTIHVTNPVTGATARYIEFEIRLASAIDLSVMRYVALHFTTSTSLNGTGEPTRLDFGPNLSNSTIRFGESAGGTYASAAIAALKVDTETALLNASHYVWFDLQSIARQPLMPAITLIRVRFPAQNFFQIGYVYLKDFIQGGEFYHHNPPVTMLLADPSDDAKSGGPVAYAFNVTEAAQPPTSDYAQKVSLPAVTHLGTKPEPNIPYLGSIVTATIPVAPTPFTNAAVLHAYRQVGSNWYQLAASADNSVDFTIVDTLSDVEILTTYSFTVAGITTGPKWGDTYTNNGKTFTIISAPAAGAGTIIALGTGAPAASGNLTRATGAGDAVIAFSAFVLAYPITTLTFAPITAAGSGQVVGVINIVEWKGSLLYLLANGEVAGSQSNVAQNVEWDGIVLDLTGVDPSAFPRTLQIAANGLPCLVGVGGAVLYLWTRKEGFTMRSLSTFAQADFPSKMDGVRGVVSSRAACAYEAGALFGSDDGLWYVAVNPYNPSVSTSPPDALVEVTKDNRGLWKKLIGDQTARVNLIVRTTGQDIWCFCQNRLIHISRNQRLTYGEWANGKSVAAACGDPRRGVVALFTDGSLGTCGLYLTDGGTNLAGDNGTAPSWRWRGKRHTSAKSLISVRAVYESADGSPSQVAVTAFTARGSIVGDIVPFTDPGGFGHTPFDTSMVGANSKVGGDWIEIEIAGGNTDKVTRCDIVASESEGFKIPRP